jgi:hypothetical protein
VQERSIIGFGVHEVIMVFLASSGVISCLVDVLGLLT